MLERVQKDVGCTVQEEPELVCGKSVTGGPVGVEEGLVVLNETFHPSAGTVDLLVEKLGCSIPYGGYDKARVGPTLRDLGLIDDQTWVSPGAGLILETGEETNGFSRLVCQGYCFSHQGLADLFELLVSGLSQSESPRPKGGASNCQDQIDQAAEDLLSPHDDIGYTS
mgnify:CR=1 FL=1